MIGLQELLRSNVGPTRLQLARPGTIKPFESPFNRLKNGEKRQIRVLMGIPGYAVSLEVVTVGDYGPGMYR